MVFLKNSPISGLKELLSWMLMQQKNTELFAMMVWSIWTQRNQVRLRQNALALHQIALLSKERYAKFLACQILPIVRQPRTSCRWLPPPIGYVKTNFDGAVFFNENKAGLGVIIRDSSDLVLASCSEILSKAYTSNEVEALAWAKTLSFAKELGITKCSKVIHWLLSKPC